MFFSLKSVSLHLLTGDILHIHNIVYRNTWQKAEYIVFITLFILHAMITMLFVLCINVSET